MDPSSIKVTCLQVSSPAEKVKTLFSIVLEYYEKKKPLLLKTETQEATEYLDKLLWELPKESFLPHSLSYTTPSYIYISCSPSIPAHIHSIFNFTKEALVNFDSLTKIYELEDLTSKERQKIFENKYKTYSDHRYHLISL